jgi:hypothetical protein
MKKINSIITKENKKCCFNSIMQKLTVSFEPHPHEKISFQLYPPSNDPKKNLHKKIHHPMKRGRRRRNIADG